MEEKVDDIGTPKQRLTISSKALPAINYWKPGNTYEVIMKVALVQKMDMGRGTQGLFEVVDVEVPEEMPDIDEMDMEEFSQYAADVKRKGTL